MSYPPPGENQDPYQQQQPYGQQSNQPGSQPSYPQSDPYGAQPGSPAAPYGGQTFGGQPPGGQPYGGQPYGGQQYGGPTYGGQQYPAAGYPAPATGTNIMAILSLVFAFVFAPVGIVLGHVAKRQIKQTGEQGSGLATAGLVISYVFTGLYLLACAFVIIAGIASSNGTSSY
jgi:hypothetical protein